MDLKTASERITRLENRLSILETRPKFKVGQDVVWTYGEGHSAKGIHVGKIEEIIPSSKDLAGQ